MRRALVTGATGGLGMALVAALVADGYEVLATGRDRKAGEALRVLGAGFTPADLTAPNAAERLTAKAQVIFHAAQFCSPWGARGHFSAVNVEATRRLVDAAAANGADAFIHLSTAAVYA